MTANRAGDSTSANPMPVADWTNAPANAARAASSISSLEPGLEELECLGVALRAPPLDRRDAQIADHGDAPPLLALVDGRQMHLHRRQPRHLEGVPDRPRVVGPRARVEDQAVGALPRAVEPLHELALVVRLREARLHLEPAGELLDLHLELGQRDAAVVLGL